MELVDKILDISNNVKDKSNKDLFFALGELQEEFEKTKQLIIELTRHLDNVESMYNTINEEIGKRVKK
jgi:hypothetical protein